MSVLDVKCVLIKHKQWEDWYTIERAEHDDRHWDIEADFGHGYRVTMAQYSGRLGEGNNSADIEGSAFEMLAVAIVLDTGGMAHFKRVSARSVVDGVQLMSPRNSQEPVTITHERARELAMSIRAVVRE